MAWTKNVALKENVNDMICQEHKNSFKFNDIENIPCELKPCYEGCLCK